VARTNAMELCRKLKNEATVSKETGVVNELKLRILDYFINRNVPDDVFEEALKTRLRDPDPAKEQSKIICAQILKAWSTTK
jgi:hypothetical protein